MTGIIFKKSDAFDGVFVEMGNEALGALVRGAAHCVEEDDWTVPFAIAKLIAPDEVWAKLESVGMVARAEDGHGWDIKAGFEQAP